MRKALNWLSRRWQQFWFAETNLGSLCLFRVAFGVLASIVVLSWLPDLFNLFSDQGVVSAATLNRLPPHGRFSLLLLFPQSAVWLVAMYALLLLAALSTAVGFCTRTSLIVLFTLLISFQQRNQWILIGSDYLLVDFALILILSPCASAFSIDAWLSCNRRHPQSWTVAGSVWPLRLLQLQMAAVYFQSFFGKLSTEVWRNGTAVYYTAHTECFHHLPVPYLFDHLWSCQMLTWLTMAIELGMFTLVWFKPCRYKILLCGCLLHLGIEWSMNIPFFEYAMIISYLAFVDGSDLQRVVSKVGERLKAIRLTAVQGVGDTR